MSSPADENPSLKIALIIIAACSLIAACETLPGLKFGGITPEDAIALAKKEIVRRHLRLPVDHTVNVKEAIIDEEPGALRVYNVDFSFRNDRHVHPVYLISVNLHSGAIENFLDNRDVRPANVSLRDFLRSRKTSDQ